MIRLALLAALGGLALLATPASAASPSDAYGADSAAVKGLCTAVMTPKDAAGPVAAQIDGLCECTLGGINAFGEAEANKRFYRVWAIFAARRDELNALPEEEREKAADAVLTEVYGEKGAEGRTEMKAYAATTMKVADICTAGFAASGTAPPEFSALGFLLNFSEP